MTTIDQPTAMPEPTRDPDRLLTDLIGTGVAIAADAIAEAELVEARSALRVIAEQERAAGTAILEDGSTASGDYRAGANQRIVSLLAKDRGFWPLALASGPLRAARELFGASYGYPGPVVDQLRLDAVTLSSMTANIAAFGGLPMDLHADQGFAPATTPLPLLLNVVWPLVDFTSENGATRVVPGSHRRRTDLVDANTPDAIPVEAPAGSAILIDGRTWHGTGANRTDSPRDAVLTTYCMPWVRPFANHFLEWGPAMLAEAPAELLELLGARRWFVFGFSEAGHLATLGSSR